MLLAKGPAAFAVPVPVIAVPYFVPVLVASAAQERGSGGTRTIRFAWSGDLGPLSCPYVNSPDSTCRLHDILLFQSPFQKSS